MYISLWKKLVDPANWLKVQQSQVFSGNEKDDDRQMFARRLHESFISSPVLQMKIFDQNKDGTLGLNDLARYLFPNYPMISKKWLQWIWSVFLNQDLGSGGKFPAAVQAWCACTLLNLTAKWSFWGVNVIYFFSPRPLVKKREKKTLTRSSTIMTL